VIEPAQVVKGDADLQDALIEPPHLARFINHSCKPNCYVHITGGVIWIRAARPIEPGEELTYHYNTDGEGLIRCRCRKGCQTLL
jgi:hypothetical protein